MMEATILVSCNMRLNCLAGPTQNIVLLRPRLPADRQNVAQSVGNGELGHVSAARQQRDSG